MNLNITCIMMKENQGHQMKNYRSKSSFASLKFPTDWRVKARPSAAVTVLSESHP